MSLKTVRVPAGMEAPFLAAEKLVSEFFRERRDAPERGEIEIFGERYVLVRAASLSVEFFSLVEDLYGAGRRTEADDFARNILFDLAHAIGKSDARNFHAKMHPKDPIERLSAGPIHFAYTGWASVDIFPESRPSPDEGFYLVFDHPYSFESDAWLRRGERRDFPVCTMNAGYSSGWCEESFGVTLVSSEILCRAQGDPCCRFVMAHPSKIEARVAQYVAGSDLKPRVAGYSIPDFFARKRMEEELRKSHDELEKRVAERTAELRDANARLMQEMAEREEVEQQLRQAAKLEALGRLAGGIAHDFNNLMAIILTRVALFTRRLPAGDPQRTEIAHIQNAAERAAKLTRQLLAFSRADALRDSRLDLSALVGDLQRSLIPLIGEDIELVARIDETAGAIDADRGQIEQVVMNLVVNARDAMPRGGTLTMETSAVILAAPRRVTTGELPVGRYVTLTVRDTGTGMPPETITRIFDPFFTTKTAGRGTGLGLSITYGVVNKAGGGIAVASEPGVGTAFTLYFPRAEGEANEITEEKRRSDPPVGTETILLVEDEKSLRAALTDVLESSGYRVLAAEGPLEALELFAAHAGKIRVLLTDVVMPKMDGRELAERIAAAHPDVRVVFMSGYAPDAASVGAPRARGGLFLTKPFAPEDLLRKLREILG